MLVGNNYKGGKINQGKGIECVEQLGKPHWESLNHYLENGKGDGAFQASREQ